MKVYTIHEPPNASGAALDRAEQLVFVRDGFSWLALIAAPVPLALHSMWLLLGVYAAVALGIGGALEALGTPAALQSLLLTGLHLGFAWDFDALHRWTLARKGWRLIGTVSGRSFAECERRFFEGWRTDESPHDATAPAAA